MNGTEVTMMRARLSLAALGLALAGMPAHADQSAPDCSAAKTAVEQEICRNAEFTDLDNRIATLLAQALAIVSARDADALRADQRVWQRDRDECGGRVHGNPPVYDDVDACLRRELNAREGLLRVVVASRQFTKP
jgi:uncharacterized protein YecT (DUF1311 family)